MKIQLTVKKNVDIRDAFDAVLVVKEYVILDSDRNEFGHADYVVQIRSNRINVKQFFSKKGNSCYIVALCKPMKG
jgi:hypothetical protein